MKQIIWSYWNHESLDFLRRCVASQNSIFTLGEWLDEWYDRIHTEELVKKGAEMGINTIYTHFFKGFGLVHEKEDMERTRELVEICHKYGIEVLGYMQLGTLTYETMLDEIPESRSWMMKDQNGKAVMYAAQYSRERFCVENKDLVEYYKKVIDYGLEHVGLDGIYFDGASSRECYCDTCQKSFKEYLTKNIKEPRKLMGINHFNHVEIPPQYEGRPDELHDILVLHRGRFRHYQLAKLQNELYDYIRAQGGKYVMHNPGLLRKNFVTQFNPQLNPKSCELVVAENLRFINRKDGKNITNILAHKVGERFGFKIVDSTWYPKGENNYASSGIPTEKHVIERFLVQPMIYGGITGSPWFIRSTGVGSNVIIDDENHFNCAKKVFEYFKQNEKVYSSTSVARVKLLYNTDTFYGYVESAYDFFQQQAEWLNDSNVPFEIIVDEDIDNTKAGELIVVPDYKYSATAEYEKLKKASERGVKILLIGQYGVCNELGRPRDRSSEIINLKGINTLVSEIPSEYIVKTDAENTLTEFRNNANGNLTLNLLRIENNNTLDKVNVEFDISYLKDGKQPVVYSIDEDCKLNSIEITDKKVKLEVANLTTMITIEFVK